MKDAVSEALNSLAAGLRPYVAGRVTSVLRDTELADEIMAWDAQGLMIFMWERWNDLFRNELSFVERSLISELRDFRNRWAHQDQFDEFDVYRVLDDIARLLKAVNSGELATVTHLRAESLHRLWLQELGDDERHRKARVRWPYILCGASGVAIGSTILAFGSLPWSLILASLVFLAMMRIAFLQSTRESHRSPGPHECSHCGRIIYSVDCPYCSPPVHEPSSRDSRDASVSVTGNRPSFRATHDIAPARHEDSSSIQADPFRKAK